MCFFALFVIFDCHWNAVNGGRVFCKFNTRRNFFSKNQFNIIYYLLYTMTQEQNTETVARSMENVKELF